MYKSLVLHHMDSDFPIFPENALYTTTMQIIKAKQNSQNSHTQFYLGVAIL